MGFIFFLLLTPTENKNKYGTKNDNVFAVYGEL